MEYIYFENAPHFCFVVPDNRSKTDFSNFAFTLDSVTYLFELYFPELESMELTIFNKTDIECPICYRGPKQIYLNSDCGYWCQAAYQFAHELCHYIIPYDVAPNLCWLEESICQVASIFFLSKLSKYWRRIGVSLTKFNGDLYYPSFAEYAERDASGAMEFDICNSTEIQSLEINCIQREKNKYIANLLLPIFRKYPKMWRAVTSLGSIAPNLHLHDSLKNWIEIAPPDSHDGLVEISHLFGVPENLL